MLASMVDLQESAQWALARAVNCVMTATYWGIGRRIVELEQGGEDRAEYGLKLLETLSRDLTGRFGRGFSVRNLRSMRMFYREWSIRRTLSAPRRNDELGYFYCRSHRMCAGELSGRV